jgi:hypothetical protein
MRNPDFTLVSSRFPASPLLPAQESGDTTKGIAVLRPLRPRSVGFAALTQLLTAVPFLLSILVVWTYGADAQAAAETPLPAGIIVASSGWRC